MVQYRRYHPTLPRKKLFGCYAGNDSTSMSTYFYSPRKKYFWFCIAIHVEEGFFEFKKISWFQPKSFDGSNI